MYRASDAFLRVRRINVKMKIKSNFLVVQLFKPYLMDTKSFLNAIYPFDSCYEITTN